MLRITSRDADGEWVLKLEGCLAGPWVSELDTCWREALHTNRPMRVDLTDVCHVDDAGRELMTLMYHAGAHFVATGCLIPELVREISEAVGNGRRS
jgi:hypothetical protein